MNLSKTYLLLFLTIACQLFSGCAPVIRTGDAANTLGDDTTVPENGVYEDVVYAQNIKTVQLNYDNQPLFSAVLPIDRTQPLIVTFDELENGQTDQSAQYSFQLIHCNADWTKSRLYNVDYLYGFNEFNINNENFSYNTKVPFVHLNFEVPQVKVPGNYAIKVYRGDDPNDVVFIKRLMVYQSLTGIAAEVIRPSNVSQRDRQHQLEFVIDYSSLEIANPLNDVHVVIRQNWQWYNAITGVKPSFVQQIDKRLEYRNFDGATNFYAGNEYRYFDIRMVNSLGQNIGRIDRDQVPYNAYLLPDKSRGSEAYSQYQEQNGAYFIGNAETRGDLLNSDYLNTHFFLNVPEISDGEVYVTGAFNDKTLTEANKMHYDAELEGYTVDILLKQGFYNYLYYVKSASANSNPYRFEGNFYQTEDLYEVFAYVRPLGSRADLLVGYTKIFSNPQ